jgi:predicted TIM-barrel fold metal-dependent hydrolase
LNWIDEPDYYRDHDLPRYEEEFADFLPERLLDCHVHTFLLEHMTRPPTEEEAAKSFGSHEMPFSAEDLAECAGMLFPEKHYEALIFGTPSPYYGVEAQNAYVAEQIAQPWLDGLALLDPGLPTDDLDRLIEDGGFVGLKPYDRLTGLPLDHVTIRHMVPDGARAVAEARGLLIMLHVPRVDRIADPANIHEVRELCEECPGAKVILAHIGRSYGPWYIEQAIGELRELPNLWYDIAALDDADSISVVLDNCGDERLLFGTDLPIAAHRGKHLCVNRQCLFLTRRKFPWSISSDEPGALKLTFFAYETIRALRRAAERRNLTPREIEDVCHNNARRLIDGVKAQRSEGH